MFLYSRVANGLSGVRKGGKGWKGGMEGGRSSPLPTVAHLVMLRKDSCPAVSQTLNLIGPRLVWNGSGRTSTPSVAAAARRGITSHKTATNDEKTEMGEKGKEEVGQVTSRHIKVGQPASCMPAPPRC